MVITLPHFRRVSIAGRGPRDLANADVADPVVAGVIVAIVELGLLVIDRFSIRGDLGIEGVVVEAVDIAVLAVPGSVAVTVIWLVSDGSQSALIPVEAETPCVISGAWSERSDQLLFLVTAEIP